MRSRVEWIGGGLMLASCVSAPLPRTLSSASQPAIRLAPVAQQEIASDAGYEAAAKREFAQTGYASWYGHELGGHKTANGEIFNPNGFTAAHRTLPMPSYVEVTTLDTGRTVVVRINDRGPYHGDRIIDLSLGAARQLGMTGHGARLVHIRRIDPPELERRRLRRGLPVAVRQALSSEELADLRIRNGWSPPKQAHTEIPAGGGPYFVQVATFTGKHRAETLAAALDAEVAASGAAYRVRLGPFADAGRVKTALAPLAAKGYPDVRIVR